LLAIQFLTRLPVPGLDGLTEAEIQHGLRRAPIWFPLVGALVGAITAATLLLGDTLWPRIVAVLIALAVEARLTGAFHEDAVADFCDALGGGHDRESSLRIMKDSRIGTYGALGLVFAVGLRAALLFTLPLDLILVALIASACFGRLLAVAAMTLIPPPQESSGLASQVRGREQWRTLAFAALLALPGLLPLLFMAPLAFAAAALASILFLIWFHRLLVGRIGGATGDCLGFAAYAGQLILLLAVAAG
jgi:adenosylcobinamide-GDP ribazoletransferase